MSEFMIDMKAVERAGREISDCKRELKQIMFDINYSRRMLNGGIFLFVRRHLGEMIVSVNCRSEQCGVCGDILTEIAGMYRNTEQKLTGRGAEENTSSDSGQNIVRDWFEDVIDKIKRRIDEIIHRWNDDRDVDAYEVDSIVFDEDKTDGKQYGGDQGSAQYSYGEKRQQIYEIIRDNYPDTDLTDDQLEAYLEKMNNEGCGYVAMVNTIFEHYAGREEEFEAAFGYPMYDENGDLNYDLLIADFYSSTDNRSVSGGKIDYQDDYVTEYDGSGDDYDFWMDTTGTGSSLKDNEKALESFMEQHGCEVDVNPDANVDIYNYQRLSEEGKQVVVAFRNGNVYNMDGTVRQTIEGGHAMVVTGVTDDGKLIVSTWGEQCYIDPYETLKLTYDDNTYTTSMTFATVEYK